MANFTRIRLPGFWIAGSVVDPEEFEALDAIRELLPNFGAGSTHAPTDPIILGGAGLNMTGPTDIDGDVDQDAGSTWSMNGTVNYLDNSLLDMKVSSTQVFRTGSLLQLLAGADMQIAGNAEWQANNWPMLTSRTIERNKWRLGTVMYTEAPGNGPGGPIAWLSQDISGTVPTIRTAALSNQLLRFVVELLELPPGATLESVTISTQGIAGDSDLDLPTYTLFRWKGTSFDNMSATTADAHTGANWTSSAVDTVVTCTDHEVIDGSYSYGILVYPPAGDTPASMFMRRFKVDLDASSIQL